MSHYGITIHIKLMNVLLFFYSLLLAVFCVLGAPAWILKMRRRGGWGTGLLQRIGVYKDTDLSKYRGTDYYHAVSVGEAIMALKVIAELEKNDPDYRAVIACTTATGHEIIRNQRSASHLLIYAPLDFTFLLRRLFSRLKPRQIILVDSELWPNLLRYTSRNEVALKIINGRISDGSYRSFLRFRRVLQPLLKHVSAVCVDGETQSSRWLQLGVLAESIHDVGSLKFDFNGDAVEAPDEFIEQINAFPETSLKVLLASTHAPEEEVIARELQSLSQEHLLMVAPRHAERRDQVKSELADIGYKVTSRSSFTPPSGDASHAFLLDTTGELARWTSLADIVIIGKSWLNKRGGQNPFEAVSQQKLVICGPNMNNFEPLFSELVSQGGIVQLDSPKDIVPFLEGIAHSQQAAEIARLGKVYLSKKLGATEETAVIIGY